MRRTYSPQGLADQTLWEAACDVADGVVIDQERAPHYTSVIAVFPTMTQAMAEQQVERADIHLTGWCSASMMGRRALAIVVDRADFLEAWAYKPTSEDPSVNRELAQRRDWLMYSLMCRLVPGGRIVLV